MKPRSTPLSIGLALLAGAGGLLAGPPASEPGQVQPLLVGAEVPAVTLTDAEGAAFDLRAAVAKKPAVVIFYRGGW